MAAVFVESKVNEDHLALAREDYGAYLKIVVDVERDLVAIGGQWHADAEKILFEKGADKGSVWGGGIDLDTKNIETVALINLRPNIGNNSQEILNEDIRKKFTNIVKQRFMI